MASATVTAEPKTAIVTQPKTEAWKQQSVGDFFARCNWDNLEIPVLDAVASGEAVVLDYSLSVGQFFGAISWDGGAMLTAPTVPAAPDQNHSEPAFSLPSLDGGSAPEELPELDEIADESHLGGGDVTLDDFLGSFSL